MEKHRGVGVLCRRLIPLLALIAGCGDDARPKPAFDFTDTQTRTTELSAGTLADVLALVDLDGDGDADQDDLAVLEACLQNKEPRCDLDGDGVVDQRDLLLARFWIGSREPREQVTVDSIVGALERFASGEEPLSLDPNVMELFSDLDGDGDRDRDDVQKLLDFLREGPATRLDRTNDGIVDFDDVWTMARSYSEQRSGLEIGEDDLTGNGQFGPEDLRLAASVALVHTEIRPGFLDVNGDHSVDVEDYCLVSHHPYQMNFFVSLMPEAEADAAFEAELPTLLTCRRDGKSIARFPVRTDTATDYVVRPTNLYLQPVSEVPADYELGSDTVPSGAALYVIGTEVSEHRVEEVRFPWLVGTAPVNGQISFSGDLIDGSAVLLTPTSASTLSVGAFRKFDIPEADLYPFRDTEKLARTRFFARLRTLEARYQELIDGCPEAGLSDADKTKAIGYLVRYLDALRTIEDYARFRRGLLANQHTYLLSNHVSMMTASASGWDSLQQAFLYQTAGETALLIADIAKEGNLGKALVTAAGNLATEYLPPGGDDELPVYLTGEGDMLTDIIDGIPLELLASGVQKAVIAEGAPDTLSNLASTIYGNVQIKQTLLALVQSPSAPTPAQLRAAMSSLRENLFSGGLSKLGSSALETIFITMIKNIPKMIVNYQIRQLLAADVGAVAGARALADSTKRLAVWDTALQDIRFARELVTQLQSDFLAKAGAVNSDGVLSCAAALDSALFAAEEAYDFATAGSIEPLEALNVAPEGNFQTNCHTGELKESLEAKRAGRDLATFAIDSNGDATEQSLTELFSDATAKQIAYRQEVLDYEATCATRLDDYGFDYGALDDAENALAVVGEAQTEYVNATNAAWAAYDACDSGNPFNFTMEQLIADLPWDADENVHLLIPEWTMVCCGDGVIDLSKGEECDPGTGDICDTGLGLACNPQTCTCAPAGRMMVLLDSSGFGSFCGNGLLSMALDATDQQTILDPDTGPEICNPSLSHTGLSVLYTDTTNWSIAIRTVAGAGSVNLTPPPGDYYDFGVWSVDDVFVAYQSTEGQANIYRSTSEGLGKTRLTPDPPHSYSTHARPMSFSPDGTQLARAGQFEVDLADHVYVGPADSIGQLRLNGAVGTDFAEPIAQWIDDTRMAFLGDCQIWGVDTDGLNLSFIGAAGCVETGTPRQMRLSPDKTRIAYVARSSDEIHVVNVDGTDDTIIVSSVANGEGIKCIDWSPDSTKIVYDDYEDVRVVEVDTLADTLLTTFTGRSPCVLWTN